MSYPNYPSKDELKKDIKEELEDLRWNVPAVGKILDKTVKNLKKRNITVEMVDSKEEAKERLISLIPAGASVMTGSSTSLYQIGFMDYYLSSEHDWNALGPDIFDENDAKKKRELRRNAETADYFIASVNAITEEGQLISVDASGSRVSAFPYAAQHLILVAGIQKITLNIETGMRRIREYVFPLENARAKRAYGQGSSYGKWVIIENELKKGRITLILVQEELGF